MRKQGNKSLYTIYSNLMTSYIIRKTYVYSRVFWDILIEQEYIEGLDSKTESLRSIIYFYFLMFIDCIREMKFKVLLKLIEVFMPFGPKETCFFVFILSVYTIVIETIRVNCCVHFV